MNISPKERFLDICHFKRPGDLFLIFDCFWEETLEKWVEQGAPKQIIDPRFREDYFQFQYPRWLSEIKSGIRGASVMIDLGHGITEGARALSLLIPGYEPRFISEDERTVTYINDRGQTVKALKGQLSRMPTFLDWPVKDRDTWNEHKKRLDPNAPGRWPADWNTYVQEMNKLGEEIPLALEVGGFYFYPRE